MELDRAPVVRISTAVRSDSDEIVRMLAALSEQQQDPVANFDADTAARDLFSDEPWVSADVARADAALCGIALWHIAYETSYAARGAYIVSLWVDPPFRRLGIATGLVAAVADSVAQKGGSYVWWTSKPWNQEAHATYASLDALAEPVMAHALVGEAFERLVNRHRKEAAAHDG